MFGSRCCVLAGLVFALTAGANAQVRAIGELHPNVGERFRFATSTRLFWENLRPDSVLRGDLPEQSADSLEKQVTGRKPGVDTHSILGRVSMGTGFFLNDGQGHYLSGVSVSPQMKNGRLSSRITASYSSIERFEDDGLGGESRSDTDSYRADLKVSYVAKNISGGPLSAGLVGRGRLTWIDGVADSLVQRRLTLGGSLAHDDGFEFIANLEITESSSEPGRPGSEALILALASEVSPGLEIEGEIKIADGETERAFGLSHSLSVFSFHSLVTIGYNETSKDVEFGYTATF